MPGFFFKLLLLVSFMSSCRTSRDSKAELDAEFSPEGIPMNWGHLFPSKPTSLSAEAVLANAAARQLNQAAAIKSMITGIPENVEIVDGITSVPVKFISNDGEGRNEPFGDGQKNASVGWTGWPGDIDHVPLAMTLIQMKSANIDGRMLLLEPSVRMIQLLVGDELPSVQAEISDDGGKSVQIELLRDIERGVYRAVLLINAESKDLRAGPDFPTTLSDAPKWMAPLADRWAWPRMKIRFFSGNNSDNRYWPILFRFPAQLQADAQISLPENASVFAKTGRQISLPPYEVGGGVNASNALQKWYSEIASINQSADFFPAGENSGVHDQYIDVHGHLHKTASGGVDTYVIKENVGNTQVLYTCFDARNVQKESQWGVPSGAGWHSIGHELAGQPVSNWTFAETVVNSMEKSGIFAGWGVRSPYPFAGDSPFEAKDVTTFRVLRSNEAYTTAKRHFHWYAVDASQKICTIIWKHLGCELISDQALRCRP